MDVHPPHAPILGWRDFLIHLFTITVGLLIALGLEGCVEWLHHRHLVHDAEVSLHREIAANAKAIGAFSTDLHREQKELEDDVTVLKYLVKNGKMPEKNKSLAIGFHIDGLNDVSWKTAQSTGAVAYMSYADAEIYSDIYATQDELYMAQKQAARDAIISIAPFMGRSDDDGEPTPAQGAELLQKIQIFAGQLQLVDGLVTALDRQYRKYLGEPIPETRPAP